MKQIFTCLMLSLLMSISILSNVAYTEELSDVHYRFVASHIENQLQLENLCKNSLENSERLSRVKHFLDLHGNDDSICETVSNNEYLKLKIINPASDYEMFLRMNQSYISRGSILNTKRSSFSILSRSELIGKNWSSAITSIKSLCKAAIDFPEQKDVMMISIHRYIRKLHTVIDIYIAESDALCSLTKKKVRFSKQWAESYLLRISKSDDIDVKCNITNEIEEKSNEYSVLNGGTISR